MKITGLIVIALALATTTTAEANRRSFGGGGGGYESNGKFGLGLELGEPTGVNGKYFLAPDGALDFGIGDIYHSYYGDYAGLHLYLDYLWHPAQLTSNPTFKLPFYIGVGGRIWFFDYNCDRFGNCASAANAFGIRVPVGITFDFNNVPLDIFIQFVPTLDFYRQYTRNVYLDVDFSVGIRYWFS